MNVREKKYVEKKCFLELILNIESQVEYTLALIV